MLCSSISVSRALCLVCRGSWVRVPPRAALFFRKCFLGVVDCLPCIAELIHVNFAIAPPCFLLFSTAPVAVYDEIVLPPTTSSSSSTVIPTEPNTAYHTTTRMQSRTTAVPTACNVAYETTTPITTAHNVAYEPHNIPQ